MEHCNATMHPAMTKPATLIAIISNTSKISGQVVAAATSCKFVEFMQPKILMYGIHE